MIKKVTCKSKIHSLHSIPEYEQTTRIYFCGLLIYVSYEGYTK